jgi:hypothetical protein
MMNTREPDGTAEPSRLLSSGARLAIGGLGVVFCSGAAVGFAQAVIQSGDPTPIDIGIAVLLGSLAIACGWLAIRELLPRKRLAGGIIAVMLLVGQMLEGGSQELDIFSSEPIAGWMAMILIAVIAIPLPWLTWKWHSTVDEHEASAYRDGAVIAIYVYALLSAIWWIGWRGDLLPEPNGLAIFMVVNLVWLAVWMWRRSRCS